MHEDYLYSNNIGNKEHQLFSKTNDEEAFQMSINNQLPLKDEDSLLSFEDKLKEISFRNKMVIYIYIINIINYLLLNKIICNNCFLLSINF